MTTTLDLIVGYEPDPIIIERNDIVERRIVLIIVIFRLSLLCLIYEESERGSG